MSFFGKLNFCLGVLVLASALTGCVPDAPGQVDEEKEAHFVAGKNRVNTLDYAGAIEEFEASLEVNAHSAAAHYQLAWLFDEKEPVIDPATAIYHYQEYLRLTPKADNAEVIRQRIYSCKQRLAADVLPLPSAPATMKQIEDLTEKNHKLQEEVDKWRAYYASQPTPTVQTSPTPDDVSPQTTPAVGTTSTNISTNTSLGKIITRPQPPKIPKLRTHVVAAGDTLASIARKYHVSLAALQTVNPGVSPKKIRVGQTLNVPAA
jgi:LysM repeat protein